MRQDSLKPQKRVLIMSCSGAANVGQLSNQAAAELVAERFARPFCLAGIGAHRKGFLRAASEADNIVIDGCAIACGKMILEHAEIPVKRHLVVTDLGFEKNMSADLSRKDIEKVKHAVKELWEGDEDSDLLGTSDIDSSCCS